jgi:FKBP-type peptidyl-prolyl cis-trans isomerase
MRLSRLLVPVVALALTGPLAACSSSDSVTSPSLNDTGVVETTTFAPEFGIDLSAAGWTHTTNGLYYRTVIAAPAGADTIAAANQVTVNYAVFLVNGVQVDGGTFAFVPGTHGVIPGFEQGVAGMHIGERRLLLIPAALGYGATGAGPIPPNATLVFLVEVVSSP